MTIETLPEQPRGSAAESLVRALEYLQREAEELGLSETAFLIGVSIKSISVPDDE